MKTRRRVINALPASLARPLARLALPTVTNDTAVIHVARSFVGVPFRHQGRSREHGIDCVGLPIVVLRELQALPDGFEDVTDYERMPHHGNLDTRVREYCTPLLKPVPGCLVAIRWKKELAHVAIHTGSTLIHSFEWRNQVVEHGIGGRWSRLIVGAWALPGVRYG